MYHLKQRFFLKLFVTFIFLFGIFWVKITDMRTYCCTFRKYKHKFIANCKSTKTSSFLQSTGIAWASFFVLRCLCVSTGYAQCCKVLSIVNSICTVLQNVSKCQSNMHSGTKYYQMSIQYAQCYKMLSNVNSIGTVLQYVSQCQLHMHIFGVTNFAWVMIYLCYMLVYG